MSDQPNWADVVAAGAAVAAAVLVAWERVQALLVPRLGEEKPIAAAREDRHYNPAIRWITIEPPTIGEYVLREVQAPKGFELAAVEDEPVGSAGAWRYRPVEWKGRLMPA